jgi:hypothetical protein
MCGQWATSSAVCNRTAGQPVGHQNVARLDLGLVFEPSVDDGPEEIMWAARSGPVLSVGSSNSSGRPMAAVNFFHIA